MLTKEEVTDVENVTETEIPESLIYEVMDSQPLYYRGYKEVLNKKKSLDDIMGSSTLQSFIISYLLRFIFRNLNEQKYISLTNELDLHLGEGTNLSGDVNIFDRSVFTAANVHNKYSDVAPNIVLEVDTKIDISKDKDLDYLHIKSQILLNFGVEKVIWIFTASRKVMIARKDTDWITKDWNQDIELLDGHFLT
ncbi:Uma2 family endonuclease [Dyadobacter psychrotolerans]|uniref:Uma2 family endonuclease n=1 Tax=Dyadobacter psychrotolerans TaxID=2541721 RepID=A0A4R5DKC5_9BACT|nr:Uma2 family endonuclease [Dyadobacter psychrotolerans]TDE12421.1 Uma2 family endonuclease [Dyadobacter psychrotolerans]